MLTGYEQRPIVRYLANLPRAFTIVTGKRRVWSPGFPGRFSIDKCQSRA